MRDRVRARRRRLFVLCSVAGPGLAAAIACSSEDAGGGGKSSGTTASKPTTFTPAEAPSQNPLPPGAGTKDGSTTTDTGAAVDTGIDTGVAVVDAGSDG
jgi:hypothetical protein